MELNKEDIFKKIVKEYSSSSFEVAEEMCIEFLEKYPEDIRVLNILGALFVQKNNFIEAIKYFEKTINIKKDYAIGYNNLGLVYRSMNKDDIALNYFQKAIYYKDDYKEAYNNIAITYQSLRKNEEATKFLEAAINIDNNYFQPFYNLGNIKAENKQFNEALSLYIKCHELNPNYYPCIINMGNAYSEIGDLENAILFMQKAQNIDPNNSQAAFNLGNIFYRYGKLNKAIEIYKNGLKINSENQEIKLRLGICYKEIGDRKNAFQILQEIISKNSENSEANYHIGLMFYEDNNDCEAIKYLEKSKFKNFDELSLVSYYRLEKFDKFKSKLKEVSKTNKDSRVISALSAHYSFSFDKKDTYDFCPDPLDFVYKSKLEELEKNEEFRENILKIIDNDNTDHRESGVVVRGIQSTGNFLYKDNENIQKLKNLIIKEIEKYKKTFKERENILIKNFPKEIIFNNSWFIKLKNAGHLNPHYHHSGWLSGAVYIKIPKKNNHLNSGDFVVGILGDKFPKIKENYIEKIINIKTGNIVLFPSSLFHRTIPFESDEERVCIAFDVAPEPIH